MQVAAPAYRTRSQLPSGAVLVVGSGETGCQIAEELVRSGRRVFLCRRAQLVGNRAATEGETLPPGPGCWAGSSARSMNSRLGSALVNPIRN